jgi:hypothetical protein
VELLVKAKPSLSEFELSRFSGWMSNSVKNGIIWVGLSSPQGNKEGGVTKKEKNHELSHRRARS